MLYKLTIADNGTKDLEPLPFLDFADLGKIEKDIVRETSWKPFGGNALVLFP